jgi:hypothetical protein
MANPSLRAALLRRSSRVTISSEAGRRSAPKNAAASCSASRRDAPRRARSHPVSMPHHVRRAKAETHSICEPHQTSMVGSFAASACKRRLAGRRSAAVRSPKHPRTSPAFPPLLKKRRASADPPRFARGRRPERSLRSKEARAGRMRPSRVNRDSRPWASAGVITGSSRATGRPLSRISTGAPDLSPSIKALRLFLASVMLAFFMEAKLATAIKLIKLFGCRR